MIIITGANRGLGKAIYSRLKKKKISRKKPSSQKTGFHKKGPSRYPSM